MGCGSGCGSGVGCGSGCGSGVGCGSGSGSARETIWINSYSVKAPVSSWGFAPHLIALSLKIFPSAST